MKLICEDVEAADRRCVAARGLVLELMDIHGEMLPWPLRFGTV
jgi:hypothetical protein